MVIWTGRGWIGFVFIMRRVCYERIRVSKSVRSADKYHR
jgi:hypothetical protein